MDHFIVTGHLTLLLSCSSKEKKNYINFLKKFRPHLPIDEPRKTPSDPSSLSNEVMSIYDGPGTGL